jgi:hypothetical protein
MKYASLFLLALMLTSCRHGQITIHDYGRHEGHYKHGYYEDNCDDCGRGHGGHHGKGHYKGKGKGHKKHGD